jgi:CubicO group peptidase (beta-lactamase class C family)
MNAGDLGFDESRLERPVQTIEADVGAGSTMFWVDPQRELVFVCLTVGLLEESRNFERLQQLSDLVLSAVVD